MKFYLERLYYKDGYIIGGFYINGVFICNTMEPARGTANETASPLTLLPNERGIERTKYGKGCCIPPGTYRVKLYLSPKFDKWLPLIQNVPGRWGILIHSGNSPKDTQGCILVGKNTEVGHLTESKATLQKIIDAMKDAEKAKEPVVLTIRA